MVSGGTAKRNRTHVIVVGGGFSGAMTAANLLREGRRGLRVTLIERGERLGPGLAYGAAAGPHLLNVRVAQLSAFPDAPEHFARWLEGRGKPSSGFAPRALFGAYVEATLKAAARRRWPSALKRVRDAVVACRRVDEGWEVTLASGPTLTADAVVLAMGHPPASAPAPFDAADLIGAWDVKAQQKLPRDGDVLVLGTGLTMVDVALSLAAKPRKGVIYALSRRGRVPLAHAVNPSPPQPRGDLPARLSGALHVLRERGREDWRAAVDSLRGATPDLWAHLPPEAQKRFLRHLRPWWDSHRHRAAPEVADRITALIAEGRLRILSGEITNAEREKRGWRLQHRGRGSRVRHVLHVSGVINCTGANHNLANWDDALVRQLLDEGLARAPANGLGFDVDPHNRLRDSAGNPQIGLYLLGPLAAGTFWETTAVPELRARAAAIAEAIT